MIKSMTGFGRGEGTPEGYEITVEIRAVNHRYFEFSSRLPRNYNYLDEKLKSFLSDKIGRGKVEVSVTINRTDSANMTVEVAEDVALGYITALRKANETLGLRDDITLSQIAKYPDVFRIRKADTDEEALWNDVRSVTQTAVDNFVSMRETEGAKMKADFENRLAYIEELVGKVEELSPQTTEAYRNRLYAKLKEILADENIEESRILTEAAIFADKTAVDEETVRLRSHIGQFRALLENDGPVGRKLDFLIQEFNREANTIGSKCQWAEITKIVVDLKSEIEKIREQVQNIE